MSRKRFVVGLLAMCCVAGLPGLAEAQSSSQHFPDSGLCAGAPNENVPAASVDDRMDSRVVFTALAGGPSSAVDTGDIPVAACDTGDEVTAAVALAFCTACPSIVAGSTVGGAACVGAACCAAIVADPAPEKTIGMTLFCDGPEPGGFEIDRDFGAEGITIAPLPAGSLIRAVNTHTNAGNTVQRDLLPDALIKIDPAGTAGDILITFNPASEGAALTIDNTPLASTDSIADQIVAGFLARGFTGTTKETSPSWSHSPRRFAGGPFVRVPNVRKGGALLSFSIRGVPNMEIEVENLEPTNIPALSTWGFGILTGLVLISTIVLLRR